MDKDQIARVVQEALNLLDGIELPGGRAFEVAERVGKIARAKDLVAALGNELLNSKSEPRGAKRAAAGNG
jgi:hypothetical protein